MAFTSSTLNAGSGGDSIATQTNSGLKYQAVIPSFGPDGGAFSPTGLALGLPVQIVSGSKATYSACISGIVPVASATDIFVLTGSDTKTVKLNRIVVSGSAGAAAFIEYQIVKRTTADSGGTSVSITPVKYLVGDASVTAAAAYYTANPTLGTSAGVLAIQKAAILTSAANTQISTFEFGGKGGECPTLTAAAQSFCLNINGVTITSGLIDVWCEFTEE